MASSGNFCVLNPTGTAAGGSTNVSSRQGGMAAGGGLKYTNITGETSIGTFGVTSGKWYFEVYISSFNADNGMSIGWVNDLFNLDAELGYNSPSSVSGAQAFGWYAETNKLIYGPGSGSSTYNKDWGGGTKVTDGDIVGIYLDADDGKFWASKNGTVFNSGDPSAGTGHGFGTGGSPHNVAISSRTLYPAIGNWSAADGTVIFNFGQDSTFQGNVSAGTETDGNGFGEFKYNTEGFLALCSANVPVSASIDPGGDDGETENPTKQFGIVTYTGNSTTGQSITGLGFKPDLIWAKMTSSSQNNQLYDSSRFNTRSPTPTPFMLRSDTNAAEIDDQAQGNNNEIISSFDTDGFTLGTSGSGPNDNTREYVAWCWRANGGVTSTNNDGTITSSVQANQAAGFSIVTFTGGGSDGTVGHGLSKAPEFIISKKRNGSQNWYVYHASAGLGYLVLNSGAGFTSGNVPFHNAIPTATVAGASSANVGSSDKYIYYCWHGVEGYSAFGNYYANQNADGVTIYTGFRPKLLFIKMTVSGDGWGVWDTTRGTGNVIDNIVTWNSTSAESSNAYYNVDILSNGFKVRSSNAQVNHTSYDPYVWGAWGDVPFKYNNGF